MTEPKPTPSLGGKALAWMVGHKVLTGVTGLVLLGALGSAGCSGAATTTSSSGSRAIAVATTVPSSSATHQPEMVATQAPPVAASTQAPPRAPAAAAPASLLVFAHAGIAEPNPTLTPGSLLATSTKARTCTAGYTATVRKVTAETRRHVFAAYRIAYPPAVGAYELDHLIPLELGGGNAATNLWPQPYHRGAGSADVKDHLENHLHALVCSGQVSLSAAQVAIGGDWWAAAARYNPVVVHRGVAAAAPAPVVNRPPTTAPAPPHSSTDQGTVHAGSFCAPAGATGHTSSGTAMVCGTTVNSPDRARWHRA